MGRRRFGVAADGQSRHRDGRRRLLATAQRPCGRDQLVEQKGEAILGRGDKRLERRQRRFLALPVEGGEHPFAQRRPRGPREDRFQRGVPTLAVGIEGRRGVHLRGGPRPLFHRERPGVLPEQRGGRDDDSAARQKDRRRVSEMVGRRAGRLADEDRLGMELQRRHQMRRGRERVAADDHEEAPAAVEMIPLDDLVHQREIQVVVATAVVAQVEDQRLGSIGIGSAHRPGEERLEPFRLAMVDGGAAAMAASATTFKDVNFRA